MNANQWERAKDIFDAALQRSKEYRRAFVLEACSDDPELLSEVIALVKADENVPSFLETPPIKVLSFRSSDEHSTRILPVGAVISGRFEIGRLLGQGGMGQVYEAKDLELGIRVALKTIRPEISSNQGAVVRFKQEVHLTRRITHGNVCRIFDLGHHTVPPTACAGAQDVIFLTMELLEGRTLAHLTNVL